MLYKSVTELIGRTPLFEPLRLKEKLSLRSRLLLKLERSNPTGSAKDRAVLGIIEKAEKEGRIGNGSVIIEPTSGNTGIALAAIGASRGYKVIIVMPDSMSIERRKLIAAYGAELVLTPGKEGMKGALNRAEELKASIPGSMILGQFDDTGNADAHYRTTGPEIWEDSGHSLDMFIAGVGTGGTITGCGRFLKEKKSSIEIVAAEPFDSPLLSEGRSGAHGIQGIGANFIPSVLDRDIIDRIMTVKTEDAYEAARLLARTEGLLCGISSGAALSVAVDEAKKHEGLTIAVILPDTGERYLSTDLWT